MYCACVLVCLCACVCVCVLFNCATVQHMASLNNLLGSGPGLISSSLAGLPPPSELESKLAQSHARRSNKRKRGQTSKKAARPLAKQENVQPAAETNPADQQLMVAKAVPSADTKGRSITAKKRKQSLQNKADLKNDLDTTLAGNNQEETSASDSLVFGFRGCLLCPPSFIFFWFTLP